ncbi:vWA domain-containing protein [Povalibacter sp.]|uniref:vWA domain-containing protein n=1 Tax=Povalibacter sp. TaxID=1962978 RepID=UPI002F3EB4B9
MSALAAFHFLYPAWLLALVPLWALIAWAALRRARDGNWSHVIDPDLLPAMRLESGRRDNAPWWVFAAVWTLASVALAGPTWHRDQSPAFRSPHDWIVVLDLSPSMDARDVTPNRTTRARYLIDDILSSVHDARVGLIVFAGDAHAVTPLTSDVENVRALLQPLTPGLLPVPGDALAPALDEANTLLRAVASRDAEVVVLTDGFADPSQALRSAAALRAQGTSVNVIGIGTAAGAGIPTDLLQKLAAAGHGEYASLSDARQLIALLQQQPSGELASDKMQDLKLETWRNEGIWFLLPLALLATMIARRGWV